MKLLYDFFPIILFFIVYKLFGIFAATAAAMLASLVQVAIAWLKHRRVEKMYLISFIIITVMGGLTLTFKDSTFIKWKPTLLNSVIAIAFLLSSYLGEKKPLIQKLLGEQITLPAQIWQRLNLAWVGFFLLTALANLYVAYHYSEATWVNFKLFGLLGLTLLFVIGQAFYLARHANEKQPPFES